MLALALDVDRQGLGHLAVADRALGNSDSLAAANLRQSITGRFYTPGEIASHLNDALIPQLARFSGSNALAVCDPFAGDGRLVFWLLERAFQMLGSFPRQLAVELWDLDSSPSAEACQRAEALETAYGAKIAVVRRTVDSFRHAAEAGPRFDVVVTNPPWENIKPDHRELEAMSTAARADYVDALRRTDTYLASEYPYSQPRKKYAGWGTNLARVGLELSLRLLHKGSVLGAVLPTSVLADDATADLRRWMLDNCQLHDVGMFPAELRAFGRADVPSITVVLSPSQSPDQQPTVTTYGMGFIASEIATLHLAKNALASTGHIVPLGFGVKAAKLSSQLRDLPRWGDLEGASLTSLWAGRELDETRIAEFLRPGKDGEFIKGRMIERFAVRERPSMKVRKPGWLRPPSTSFERLAWRDISRPSQKRRVHAALLAPGWIAGNSLGVAHFRDGDAARLRWLLGVMSSLAFELQLRALLATGHVTLASLRKVHIPVLNLSDPLAGKLVRSVDRALAGRAGAQANLEAAAFRLYGLDDASAEAVLEQFPKITAAERQDVLERLTATEPTA